MNCLTRTARVTATEVRGGACLAVLPHYLGRYMMVGESLVYTWMRRLSDDYIGGNWRYVTLTREASDDSALIEGFYMAPRAPARMNIQHVGNNFDGHMSADAAGILATSFALVQLAERYEDDTLIELHAAVMAYARTHPESLLIRRAID